jgi:hypothetical protein
MTSETQLRTRYALIHVVAIIALLALIMTGGAWTHVGHASSAIDVSAIMGSIDTGNLPVQGHVDAF